MDPVGLNLGMEVKPPAELAQTVPVGGEITTRAE